MRFFSFILLHFIFSCNAKAALQSQEIRAGLLLHDIRSVLAKTMDKTYDINGEYLFQSLDGDFWQKIYDPRIHIGASINLSKGTNQYYTGLTWHISLSQISFFELSLGGEVHNGRRKKNAEHRKPSNHKKALGSRFLFREAVSLGLKLNNQINVSIMMDHSSNANLAPPNSGITSVGFRLGYQFQH